MRRPATGDKLRIRADDWNAMLDASQTFRDGKFSARGSPLVTEPNLRFRNDSDLAMPRYGLGWLTDAVFKGLAVVKRPEYPGISRIVIAAEPIAPGGVGRGWTEGVCPVLIFSHYEWNRIVVGDRLGVAIPTFGAGRFWAERHRLGPLTVLGKIVDPTQGPIYASRLLAIVRITGQRGDAVMIRGFSWGRCDLDAGPHLAAKHIIWDARMVVSGPGGGCGSIGIISGAPASHARIHVPVHSVSFVSSLAGETIHTVGHEPVTGYISSTADFRAWDGWQGANPNPPPTSDYITRGTVLFYDSRKIGVEGLGDDVVRISPLGCQSSCETGCESECTEGCETTCEEVCENACEGDCQTACETTCQNTCESYCQDGCEVSCESGCTAGCETACESGCQSGCETTCQGGCQTECEGSCETGCEQACEEGCTTGCEGDCQAACQTACEASCQTACQSAGCQTGCEASCESGCTATCETHCRSGCQQGCQSGCENACQSGCQGGCQTVCELSGCQSGCQATCEVSCEGGCQTACEGACQSAGCQTVCENGCEQSCESGCESGCEGGCQTTCQASCQTGCTIACQQACELICTTSCQMHCESVCQLSSCETACEVSCETSCEAACETVCELACQVACEIGCEEACETGCETACELGCEDACETGCQTTCELHGCETTCETPCESGCQAGCELDCQTTCELSCEDACEPSCESACELGCQTPCELQGCQITCETGCEVSCETGCEEACETACQDACEVVCETMCESSCQETCELACEDGCEVACESGCEVACETGCEVTCETTCESSCQTQQEQLDPDAHYCWLSNTWTMYGAPCDGPGWGWGYGCATPNELVSSLGTNLRTDGECFEINGAARSSNHFYAKVIGPLCGPYATFMECESPTHYYGATGGCDSHNMEPWHCIELTTYFDENCEYPMWVDEFCSNDDTEWQCYDEWGMGYEWTDRSVRTTYDEPCNTRRACQAEDECGMMW